MKLHEGDTSRRILQDFGEALTLLSKSDQAKAEFLLLTLPSFYNNLVENLRMKESYSYGDISRQIQLYATDQGDRKEDGEQKTMQKGQKKTR